MSNYSPKDMTGIYAFDCSINPRLLGYSNQQNGGNLPTTDNQGKAATWTPTAEVLHFDEKMEQSISKTIADKGYCILTKEYKIEFGQWKTVS